MTKLKRLSDYLTGDDLEDGDIVTIVKEPVFRPKEETGFRSDTYLLEVQLPDGETMPWTPNKTTWNELLDAFTDDSENWVDKKVLCNVQVQTVMGQRRAVIYGHPVKDTAEKPATPTTTEKAPVLRVGKEPVMTRGQALDISKNWPKEDREAWLDYLKSQGKLKD